MHKHQTQASLITQKAVLSIDSSRLDITPCNLNQYSYHLRAFF